MIEEFDLLEEVEVQFCDEECTESVWHGVKYSESLFCREKPKSELTLVIKEEGMMYFLTADIKEFAWLCQKHGWYIVSHQRFNEAMEIGELVARILALCLKSFRQLKRKMEQLGALSVAGVFLGKTV